MEMSASYIAESGAVNVFLLSKSYLCTSYESIKKDCYSAFPFVCNMRWTKPITHTKILTHPPKYHRAHIELLKRTFNTLREGCQAPGNRSSFYLMLHTNRNTG